MSSTYFLIKELIIIRVVAFFTISTIRQTVQLGRVPMGHSVYESFFCLKLVILLPELKPTLLASYKSHLQYIFHQPEKLILIVSPP